MTKYIQPPRSEECEWRSGPPPEIGWWPASMTCDPDCIRFWNGWRWSLFCTSADDISEARRSARKRAPYHNDEIRWTDRWWLK
jgi:hypothetical protein